MNILQRQDAKRLGLSRYFTGIPCKSGHISERQTCSSNCLECKRVSWNSMSEEKRISQLERMRDAYKNNGGAESSKERSRILGESNPELYSEKLKEWRKNNAEKCRDYARKKMRKKRLTPEGKAEDFFRKSIYRIVESKSSRSEKILGYSKGQFILHIERQFLPGMSWDNHGEWHIDHIVPISYFLSVGEKRPEIVNCLTNLMPVWAKTNLQKGSKMEVLL